MQALSRIMAVEGKKIGLVPTMGYLHEGHLSLIRRAKKASDIVITSIFVNPTQFAPHEDLDRYPRDEKGDIRKAAGAGSDILFAPKGSQMYPEGFSTFVEVEKLTDSLEGLSRPTHFRGVTTVVAKLFNITQPDVAVFGMKDFQQAVVLRRMTNDLGYQIQLIVAPTLRETDGLAMSSRNQSLDEKARAEAVCLYFALRTAREMVRAGEENVRKIEKEMRAVIRGISPKAEIDYIAFNDIDSLAVTRKVQKGTVCSLACKLGKVRLIDNMKLL
jgi:pantoate--beta-alanine ligase